MEGGGFELGRAGGGWLFGWLDKVTFEGGTVEGGGFNFLVALLLYG